MIRREGRLRRVRALSNVINPYPTTTRHEKAMSRPPEEDDQIPIDRREFLKVGGLGAAALATGASGCVNVPPQSPTGTPPEWRS